MNDSLSKLSELSRTPDASKPPSKPARWSTRIGALLPLGLLFACLLVFWLLFGSAFMPAVPVELESVVTLRVADADEAEDLLQVGSAESALDFDGATLFQASGWIEPDPYDITVPFLTDGIVEAVYVLEGEHVHKGQLLARLIQDDHILNRDMARAALDRALGSLEREKASLAEAEAGLTTLNLSLEVMRAEKAELADVFNRVVDAGPAAVAELEISQAKLRVQTKQNEIASVLSRLDEARARVASREAGVRAAQGDLRAAQAVLEREELALSRTEVFSPMDGVVMHRHAHPGRKRMVHMDSPKSSSVVEIYDPNQLQVRVDIPLEEASRVTVGQAVRVRSSFLPDTVLHGRVTRIVGEADLQRNTLQVKVKILSPDERLRPEMLCRAEFVGESSATSDGKPQNVRVFVPEAALINGSDVFVLDPSEARVQLRSVTLSGSVDRGFILVASGLKPGDRVVIRPDSSLRDGVRVQEI